MVSSAKDGKKTGDGTAVGLFVPLPPALAAKFPSLGDVDRSPAHFTFLYVGTVQREQEPEFLDIVRGVVGSVVGPVRAELDGIDHFVHPDKGRRVAVTPVRFDKDLAALKWNLREALMDAGFRVDDKFPLVYRPHVTIAYMDGLDAEWKGSVPTGGWSFSGMEVWGLPTLEAVPFGGSVADKVASRFVDAMEHRTSVALMKFLSGVAKAAGIAEHVYVVGGAVRNFVIGQPVKDVDVVIDSVAAGKDSAWFAERVRKAIPVRTSLATNQYGVAILTVSGDWFLDGSNLKGETVEIANARKESYGGETGKGYKPHVVAPATIEEDVVRREFTFNCMAGDTLIPTEKGILRIDQIASREEGDCQDIRLTVAGQDGSAVAVGWQYSGFAPTLRVTTEWGHFFSCTPHHPVLVLRGYNHEWVQADQLEEGDLLCVPVRQVTRRQPLALNLPEPEQPKRGIFKEVHKPEVMTPELAFVIGCIVAEGSNTYKRVSFSNSDPTFISRYIEYFQTIFGFQPSRNKVVGKGSVRILREVQFVANADSYDIYADSKTVVGWLENLGLYCGGAKDGKSASYYKVVPWSILQADERSQWAFLAAYLEGDGSIRPDTGRITFCSVSPYVRQQLQVLLGAHGVLSKVKDRFVYLNAVDSALLWEKIRPWMVTKEFDYTKRNTKARNRYGIPVGYIRGFLAGRSRDPNSAVYITDSGEFKTLPEIHEPVRQVRRLLHDAYFRGELKGFLENLEVLSSDEHAKLQRLFNLGYQYVEVTSVEEAGEQDVFDISMGKGVEPAFVANGVVVHNTLMWRLQDLADGPDKAEIIDITGCGLKDLAAGEMRCPSSPDKTFSDDPSRMVRAIKFLLKYGFKIPPDVEASIRRNAGKLKNIPAGHLSNMIVGLFYEGGWGRRALDEMDKLGLLDVVKEIARTDRDFREALANWADKKADLGFFFELVDIGMPTGRRLNFLTPAQKARLREFAVQWPADKADDFVSSLEQPGRIKGLDFGGIIRELGLSGPGIKSLTDTVRRELLDDPALVGNPTALRKKVVGEFGKTARVYGPGQLGAFLVSFQQFKKSIRDDIVEYDARYSDPGKSIFDDDVARRRRRGLQIWTRRSWEKYVAQGSSLAMAILDLKTVPPGQAKALEVSARTFMAAKRPPTDIEDWLVKVAKFDTFLQDAAKTWPDKTEGGADLFVVGPFHVHNTIGAAGEELEGVKSLVEKGITAVHRLDGALAEMKKTLYGDVYVVGRLKQPKVLAWYDVSDDTVHVRPALPAKINADVVQNFVHELAHRFWGKFTTNMQKRAWNTHHWMIQHANVKVEMPKVGERLPFSVNRVANPEVLAIDGGFYVLDIPSKRHPEEHLKIERGKMWAWIHGEAKIRAFPTAYSAKNSEEHFCDAVALKSLGKLPKEHEEALDRAMSGEPAVKPTEVSIKVARVADRYLKRAGYFNLGDSILYGKYKNKPGVIKGFGRKENGVPIVLIEPYPKGRKQDKVLGLYNIWHADLAKRIPDPVRVAVQYENKLDKKFWQMTFEEFRKVATKERIKWKAVQSFEDFVKTKGINPSIFEMVGVTTVLDSFMKPNLTQKQRGKINKEVKILGLQKKLEKEWKDTVSQIALHIPLDLSRADDMAYLRVQHKREIRRALLEGLPVPLHVLQEYPDIERTVKVAARYKDKKTVKNKDGEDVTVYEYSERQVALRNKDKAERVESLRWKLDKLIAKVKKDLESEV